MLVQPETDLMIVIHSCAAFLRELVKILVKYIRLLIKANLSLLAMKRYRMETVR